MRLAGVFICLSMMVAAAGTATAQTAKQPEFIMKMGCTVAADHPYVIATKRLSELVQQRTNGRVKVNIFENSQLGSERDLVEGLQLGTVDLVATSTGPLGGFVPEMGIVDLPFLFRDKTHAYKVLDGRIGQDLMKKFDDKGIHGLAYWEAGFRHVTNNKRPVNSPSDMAGLKIRLMENKVHLAAFKALGANPTPMAWGEVFAALQQGVLDGMEGPIPLVYTSKIYEVQKYLSLTGHFYSPSLWFISVKTWTKLPPDIKKVFADTSIEIGTFERNLMTEQEDAQVPLLRSKGMQVITPDKRPFQEAIKAVYKQFEPTFGKDRIQAILDTK